MTDITTQAIREAIHAQADDIIEWTKALLRFASENRPPSGAEGPAQDFLEAACRGQGWEVERFRPDDIPGIETHPSWLKGRDYSGGREDVTARWRGTGGGRSVLLSGHVDVAPFEPDDWTVCRPFEPLLQDGRLYGRGSADMKSSLAAAFWALRILRELDFTPAGDVLWESVVDEEFAGGNGTLAARLRGHNADLAVVGEPTRMRVCPACLGAFLGDLTLTGSAGMPYMGTAIPNPIVGAARAIELFSEWQAKWRAENDHPLFTEPGSELNALLWRIDSTKPGEFTQLGTPLLTKLSWVVWCHPGMTEAEFYRRFRAFWSDLASTDPALSPFALTIEPTYHFVKPWETPAADPGVQALLTAFRKYTGVEAVVSGAPFSGDLAIYGEVGSMPSILLGPRGGNLHAPDEWVEIEDLLTLTGVYARLVSDWCGSNRP